jgi:hypothetical protein
LACFWFFPQNEHDRKSRESGTYPLYPGNGTWYRQASRRQRGWSTPATVGVAHSSPNPTAAKTRRRRGSVKSLFT